VISQQQLDQIGQLAAAQPISETLVVQLRSRFPSIHFTYCMDDDVVGVNPVFKESAFNLYLIDSRNHCLGFTEDRVVATGVVLAEIEDNL
jgi:hypothetical protein